ncbi:hypothetical protein [Archaeoglobus veneficus]|uniref:Arcadin 1 domain-containing protein n=1 Tax=Archaeoglobus veneficus (strain DSM 11195 / SNP6) TaxID=693661 RepID=F2KQR6_ARCVS|nr:hypothetical protein [Archaeoglobus veneficus]AEA46628.1 hypothetical protein Arcve_0607 [Archaeoglobus veneficus SNP6]
MKYRVVKIEMKDEECVAVHMKRVESSNAIATADVSEALRDPFKFMELSKQMGMAYMKAIESAVSDDAVLTMSYDEYYELELKVGDVVEVSVRLVDKA